MKTLNCLILTISILCGFATATDFGAGPDVFARAYEKAYSGTYTTEGSGLSGSFRMEFTYGGTVSSQGQLLAPFNNVEYTINPENPREMIFSHAEVYDKEGNILFSSMLYWKLVESFDGTGYSYTCPDYAKKVWLQLADRQIPCDADYVEVQLEYGYTFGLEIVDGQAIVPGWVYEQSGTFVEWKNGHRTATDIQTNLPVIGGKQNITFEEGSGISGITLVSAPSLYLSIYGYRNWHTTYEFTAQESGVQYIWIGNSEGDSPEGVWVTEVGTGLPATYIRPQHVKPGGGGVIQLPVQAGQTFHFVARWPERTKG